MRIELRVLAFRAGRWLRLIPMRRHMAVAIGITGGVSCVVAGLTASDEALRAFPLLLVGIGCFAFSACLWEME